MEKEIVIFYTISEQGRKNDILNGGTGEKYKFLNISVKENENLIEYCSIKDERLYLNITIFLQNYCPVYYSKLKELKVLESDQFCFDNYKDEKYTIGWLNGCLQNEKYLIKRNSIFIIIMFVLGLALILIPSMIFINKLQ